jgi:class 3 adenylate cyclase
MPDELSIGQGSGAGGLRRRRPRDQGIPCGSRDQPLIAVPSRAIYDPMQQRGRAPLAREQRKLAAIVAADVVGYSRLMGRDESGTLARLREHRKEHLEPALARYGGRLVKLTGDGALAEFPSAVDALSAAIEFQQTVGDALNGSCSALVCTSATLRRWWRSVRRRRERRGPT